MTIKVKKEKDNRNALHTGVNSSVLSVGVRRYTYQYTFQNKF